MKLVCFSKAAIVILMILFSSCQSEKSKELERSKELFRPYISEYIATSNLRTYTKCPNIVCPYITGKVILIDKAKDNGKTLTFYWLGFSSEGYVTKGTNTIDDIYIDLPQHLRANTPQEVGTIIWLEWGEQAVAWYSDGSAAYQIICDVTVIDKKRQLIIGRKQFVGEKPPVSERTTHSYHGDPPTKSILGFILAMPRNPAFQ